MICQKSNMPTELCAECKADAAAKAAAGANQVTPDRNDVTGVVIAKHEFNPEEVDIGVGIQRGETCLDCGETEKEGNH